MNQELRINKHILFLFFLPFLLLNSLFVIPASTYAQTIDPAIWQTTATGLKTQTNTDKKTAGLSFIVQDQGWPFLSLQGGVKNAGSYHGPYLSGPTGIDLGQIKVPNVTGSFTSETVDWAHNEINFSNLKLIVSRLSPAIALETQSNSLILFSGTLTGNEYYTNQWGQTDIRQITRTSFPKYIAYSSAGTVRVQTLSTSSLDLSFLDKNWILLWYGNNSHFLDSKRPLNYSGFWPSQASIPLTDAYQADAPILLIFQNQPTSIKHSSEGGVEVSFSGPSGYVSLLPLFGRNHFRVSETEGWSQGLPTSVTQKAQWWATHLCSFPTTVSETYSYNQTSDTATISESITYLPVCTGGTSFAPLPPMLSIAKDALNVQLSGTVVDGNLPTEFGPSLGIENSSSYSWSISGLKKYTDSKRIISTGQVPLELEQELNTEIDKIIASGHFAPWIFMDAIPRSHNTRGDLYWANPGDIIYHLSEIASSLPDGTTKTNFMNYIKSERATYPPEDVYDLSLTTGTMRKNYSSYVGDWNWSWTVYRTDAHQQRVPLYNFFALSRFYELTGETVPAQVLQKAKDTLGRDMIEQDWATSFWFKGFEDRRMAVVNANRHAAGLIGFIKLANLNGDTQAEELGRTLFAKAVVLRVGMAQFPRYHYTASLIELPSQPDWQPRYTAGKWAGYLFNYNWTGPYDDHRQVGTLNQFEVFLSDHSGYGSWEPGLVSPYLIAYRDLVPEVGRFLTDYAKQDAEIYLKKVEALFPHWYHAFAEGMLGSEHNLNHPIDSFQTFMAKVFIQGDTPQNLAHYASFPWLTEGGDLFYVQKLAEVVKAYKTWSWSDSPLPSVSPSPTPAHCTPLGDIDCSGKVNVLDLSALLGAFGSTTNTIADLDDSGKVNVIDLSILLSNFGK